MRKKAVTLVELLIAISLLGVIVLAATSFDVASRRFLGSVEKKSLVLNELSYVVEQMQKTMFNAHGTVDFPGFNIRTVSGRDRLYIRVDNATNPTPTVFTDDDFFLYYATATGQIQLCRANSLTGNCNSALMTPFILTRRLLSWRIQNYTTSYQGTPINSGVDINITGRYTPSGAVDESRNPTVSLNTTIRSSMISLR